MAIFKCKMCGGDLQVQDGACVVECGYCGTKQTVSATDDEKRVNLYNRANHLRMNSEFDKAASLYEQIVAEFPNDAEAYWGLCLCNYGIEYVDDPVTSAKIPTIHRASFEKMRKDENYERALENADATARIVYQEQAKEIDRIMGEVLAISQDEQPYDIFICYKETDEVGGRTVDSVIAQNIYDALSDKGYKVFFSRITLEDKLGAQYEPYIFAALNSAKVMLAVGTDHEHYNAVWVKNEWRRFWKLAAADKTKVLIPCYKDMDVYDFPNEFKGLQAQDMGKVGAMQDLLRGIDKIFGKTISAKENDGVASSSVKELNDQLDVMKKTMGSTLEEQNKRIERRQKKSRIVTVALCCLVLVAISALGLVYYLNLPSTRYDRAMRLCEKEKYDKSIALFEKLTDENYKDSGKLLVDTKKKKGVALREAGEYDEAIELFETLGDVEEVQTTILHKGVALREEGKYSEAIDVLQALWNDVFVDYSQVYGYDNSWNIGPMLNYELAVTLSKQSEALEVQGEYIEALRKYTEIISLLGTDDCYGEKTTKLVTEVQKRSADIFAQHKSEIAKDIRVGDIVYFGCYEQDNNFDNGKEKVAWEVLDKKDDKMLLSSVYVLDAQPMDVTHYTVVKKTGYSLDWTEYEYTAYEFPGLTWETSDLCKWLNGTCLNAMFSSDEQKCIATNVEEGTNGKLFLLTSLEADTYFKSNESRDCAWTPYAGMQAGDQTLYGWWLRCSVKFQHVDEDGVVHTDGDADGAFVSLGDTSGVRPAMWINLSK